MLWTVFDNGRIKKKIVSSRALHISHILQIYLLNFLFIVLYKKHGVGVFIKKVRRCVVLTIAKFSVGDCSLKQLRRSIKVIRGKPTYCNYYGIYCPQRPNELDRSESHAAYRDQY